MSAQATWYRTTLDAAQLAGGEVARRKATFSAAFTAARGPRQMALFALARPDGGLDLYLTPVCAEHAGDLLAAWQAAPCDRPSPRGLELLVGPNEITYYLP